jgi:hypothetical protein
MRVVPAQVVHRRHVGRGKEPGRASVSAVAQGLVIERFQQSARALHQLLASERTDPFGLAAPGQQSSIAGMRKGVRPLGARALDRLAQPTPHVVTAVADAIK